MDFKEFDYSDLSSDSNDFDGSNKSTSEEQIIKQYQEDEQVMIRLFVQWCVNHEVDPSGLYASAYPEQPVNAALQKVLKEMNEDEPIELANETILDVLQLFGNFELAFVVSEEIERITKQQK